MTSYSSELEHLIEELGGYGLMQILLCIVIHISSTISHWSILAMSFIGYDPGFTCQTLHVKFSSLSSLDLGDISTYRLCTVGPNATCTSYIFPHSLNTAVSEWDLVCEKRWIVAFITTIKMVGVVVGSIMSGQMADTTGRKPTLITGVTTMVLFNFVGCFAQSWKAYSAIRFFIGIGFGLYFTVQFTQMIEFVPSSWRPFVMCFPTEPIVSTLYALVSWLLYDWKRLHLLKSLIGLFFLIILCFIPESFRWLVSKRKFKRAEKSINFVAKVNRVNKPDLKKLFDTALTETNATRKISTVYTVTKLWSSKELRNITLSLSVLWFAASTAWYCMALGMESISVDIYMSIFLINLVDIPAFSVTGPLVNRCGRRNYCFVTFGLSSILSCVSGILQHFAKLSQKSASLTVAALVSSLLAKMTVSAGDAALFIRRNYILQKLESTRISQIKKCGKKKCGLCKFLIEGNKYQFRNGRQFIIKVSGQQVTVFRQQLERLGAIAAPLLIHFDGLYPGSMYFSCGVLMFLSTGIILRLKETKGVLLQDSITYTVAQNDR